jgi:hypothetical protein
MLKKLYSPKRDLAVKGLQNAAWDLTYISEWPKRFDRFDSHQEATVLVSMDKTLPALARAAIDPERQPPAFADAALTRLSGKADGRRLTISAS